MADVHVPLLLQQGVLMTKVTPRLQKSYIFRLDADQGQIIWESKKLRIIPIENIKELRSGADARYYRQQFQLAREYEDRWITIIYILDGQYKTLHLVASSQDIFHQWDITLRKLYTIRQELLSSLGNEEMRQALWVRQCWKSSDQKNDQSLSYEEVERLCRRLNINTSLGDLLRLFKQADTQGHGSLDFTDFRKFVKLLKARPDIDILYKKLSSGNEGGFSFSVFEGFMRDSQKSLLNQQDLKSMFFRHATRPELIASDVLLGSNQPPSTSASPSPLSPTLTNSDDLTMSLDAFTAFLLSPDNAAFKDQQSKIYQDMRQPLSNYFISSSHNTYLVGHQLVGDSTIEGYIRALLQSCRSVEVDIYDGDTEPMVFHGKTLTSKVPVRDVCKAIAKYAFVTSPYPIIISAELHCSLPQQDMLAAIMHEVFGEVLVSAPIGTRISVDELPSPEDLKGRVLFKAKNLYVSETEDIRVKDVTVDAESSSTETSTSDSDIAYEGPEELSRTKARNIEPIRELKEEFRKVRSVFSRVTTQRQSSEKSSPRKVKMSAALVALLVYTVGVKCRGINKKEHYAAEHMFSVSETTANKIIKHGFMDLVKHNKTHLVRVYPKTLRLSSTNYLPHRYWAAGLQLVAINWQTFDLGYMINHAMFQRNGRAGYVLKPEVFGLPHKELLAPPTLHHLDITVISAQQLPRPKDASGHEVMERNIVDPYVEVSIYVPDTAPLSSTAAVSGSTASNGTSASRSTTARTSSVRNNGFNPVWQEKLRLTFECATALIDLVFVRFMVLRDGENDDEPIAVYCISLGSLAMGYRHLPLHDSQLCQYLFATLFVKCSLDT